MPCSGGTQNHLLFACFQAATAIIIEVPSRGETEMLAVGSAAVGTLQVKRLAERVRARRDADVVV